MLHKNLAKGPSGRNRKKNINFKVDFEALYGEKQNKRALLIEPHKFCIIFYLQKYVETRELILVDESYIHSSHVQAKSWSDIQNII